MTRVLIDPIGGSDINRLLEMAENIVSNYSCVVFFRFNGIIMDFRARDTIDKKHNEYLKKLSTGNNQDINKVFDILQSIDE